MLDSLEFWEGDFTNYFNHTSKYRGPPTKELQEAWLGLWDCKHSSHSQPHSRYDTSEVETNLPKDPPIGVDDEIVKDLNKTEAKHVEIIGSDPNNPTYAAMVEVFHQLHCLVRSPSAKYTRSRVFYSHPHPTEPRPPSNLALRPLRQILGRQALPVRPGGGPPRKDARRPLHRDPPPKSNVLRRRHARPTRPQDRPQADAPAGL